MLVSNVGTQTNVFLADNQQISADTPLLPFRKDASSFWTTNACRDTASLGYTYPETQRWKFASDESYQASAASVIARLYSGRVRDQMTQKIVGEQATLFGQMLAQKNNVFTDWSLESSAPADIFRDTFRVQFALVPGGSEQSVEVGSWMVLLPAHEKVVRAQGTDKAVLSGTTSLTAALVDRINNGLLPSLDPDHVVPFLKVALTWHVLDVSSSPSPINTCSVFLFCKAIFQKLMENANRTMGYPCPKQCRIK